MKRIFRGVIVEAIVLYLVAQYTTGLSFSDGVTGIIITGGALAIATLLIKPVVNILLLPINLVTFGLFKWLGNAVTLYLVDLILTNFKVSNFAFTGLENDWFSLPAYATSSLLLSYIIFSFIIFLASSIVYWLIK